MQITVVNRCCDLLNLNQQIRTDLHKLIFIIALWAHQMPIARLSLSPTIDSMSEL